MAEERQASTLRPDRPNDLTKVTGTAGQTQRPETKARRPRSPAASLRPPRAPAPSRGPAGGRAGADAGGGSEAPRPTGRGVTAQTRGPRTASSRRRQLWEPERGSRKRPNVPPPPTSVLPEGELDDAPAARMRSKRRGRRWPKAVKRPLARLLPLLAEIHLCDYIIYVTFSLELDFLSPFP